MEKKRLKALLLLLALPGMGLSASLSVATPEQSPILLSIPSANLLHHGQYRLSGRFQYFTSSDIGAIDTAFLDSTDIPPPKEVENLNYSGELLVGIENRAELGVQYGKIFSLSLKALLLHEDAMWPDLVFGIRNLVGSQEGDLYGVTNTKTQENLQNESYATAAKSLGKRTRIHLGASVLPHATKGFASMNVGLEQSLGRGAFLGYEVFERFSDFHQVLSLQWKYRNLVALSVGMTEFQSWVRQSGEWGFFVTPSHPLYDGYNSPGITVALHVMGIVPHRELRTVPERVAILEAKNAELQKEVDDISELKRQVAKLQASQAPATTGTKTGKDSLRPASSATAANTNGSTALKPSEAQALVSLQLIAEKMPSDLSDPKEIRDLMSELVAMGVPGVTVVKHVASDTTSDSLRIPAVLVMAYSKDTTYVTPLRVLCSDPNPQMRREALTALVKVGGRQVLEDVKRRLSDPDETVALAAAEAYRQLTGEPARPVPKAVPTKKRAKAK